MDKSAMTTAVPASSCINTEHGCVMFDCLVHLWEWLDPPVPQSQYEMENKKSTPATQQPLTQQHLMAHHVHPEQIYSQQPSIPTHLASTQTGPMQPNGVMHQLLQSQYHSNINARSPLLENRHELYGTGHNHDYARLYGANDNYNYPQSPPRLERTDLHTDHNVNHELLHNIPKGYNAEVYQDYLKRNPPKDTNQIYQNHQPMHRSHVNQYGSKPYLPYSNRIGPQSNTELLRRQYNEIQQMKLQQQMHYQNQAQMHQQQKFAERQLLLQQIHGVQPPPNLQNSIYSDGSYRDLDRYSSKNDFKEYSSTDIQKDVDKYAKNNEYKEIEKHNRQYQESQWQSNQQPEYRDPERYRKQSEGVNVNSRSPPDFNNQAQKNNVGLVSPMKSSESSSPSIKSPSSDSRRSSGGNQALRSPIAQRIPSAPVTVSGILYKQGSDGLKVWRKRWFVLSEYCLFYYKSQDEEKLLGSVLLPSYKVSACTAEDKVLRKYAFKLEHANMRTYVLAAPDQDAMMKWVKALTMAALMQNPNDQPQKQSERTGAKTEDGDEIPGPTYANAPPKPRRSNEGYSSPSPDMYDPNYDLLKKPASHYSQGTSHTRYQDHTNYPTSPNQESTYTLSPQSPPAQQQAQYQTKRPYDTHHLSLPLTNTVTDRLENNQPSTSSIYRSNPQSPYFDNRNRSHQPQPTMQENKAEKIYERQSCNPFLQDTTPTMETSPKNDGRTNSEHDKKSHYNETFPDTRMTSNTNEEMNIYSRDVYGELNSRPIRTAGSINERLLIERRTPDAYGRSTTMSAYNKGKMSDYEDVYASYGTESEYGKTYAKSLNPSQSRDAISISSHQQPQDYIGNHAQEKTFSGPAVLRRKKMQSSGIQPPMPRPHSADFLEYESKNEMLNKTMPARTVCDPPKQPQRPKSSLDINSYYDPSSDRYYSEESYAEKMRQSAQYLQQGLGPRNIQIPLAKYASGLAEKQLHSPYSQITNNNYETEFATNKINRDNISYNSKFSDLEGLNSNWTLKEKENHKEFLNRSGSVMSDGSNVSAFVKDVSRFDPTSEGFIRSASARLPSSTTEKEGEKKVQQREESMKRLLEWKQRMLQSPLTRKSTPAAISLARSLNQSRQSLKSDHYKQKTYTNASYNSYSSDDEEETSGTDLQKPRDMQAGRSQVNLTSSRIMRPITPPAPSIAHLDRLDDSESIKLESKAVTTETTERTYENVICTLNLDNLDLKSKDNYCKNTCDKNETSTENVKSEIDQDGYETHESEAESETQIEYTDNDLDEVLLQSDVEVQNEDDYKTSVTFCLEVESDNATEEVGNKPQTPPVRVPGEDHYLPMSPRKISTIEPAHKTILQNLSVFDHSMPHGYEDNPYVEMNLGNEEVDMQTYEIVCVNNSKVEPVYMELSNVAAKETDLEDVVSRTKLLLDTASNFADTKDHTLKRASKIDKIIKEKSDCSDADDEASKDISLDSPFSRFSISDTFRPASYYLNGSRNTSDLHDSSDSEILPLPPIPSSSPPCEELSDEALSKYILDKLDQSDMSQDNSILKMLTSENQKMNTVKRKTTSLMIYGSRTSIHDTLSRGEKIRNSRASLTNEKKNNDTPSNLLSDSILEQYISSSIETDSLTSYNADRGSSRLSLESDISSKFEVAPSNLSSEVTSLNESESAIDLRYPSGLREIEMMIKRRPLSDDSIFELAASEFPVQNETTTNVDLDRYLDNLQPGTSDGHNSRGNSHLNISAADTSTYKNTLVISTNLQTTSHMRCSSTPVIHAHSTHSIDRNNISVQYRNISEQVSSYIDSQSSGSSVGLPKSPISYYCKNYDEEKLLSKNLNSDVLADKIKEFENEKLALKPGNETNASSTTTGFHSRESSTEHSAPYYYSDLSSQEHINLLPTSHYLKNTNLHRKLNNQRRRGPLHKKNEISHIHNPIRNNQVLMSDRSFELAASARSVSVEFLSAAEKDPEIDIKNIYESTGARNSKIPESMSLISGFGCKRNSSNNSTTDNSSLETNMAHRSSLNTTSSIKVSNASMSSHCSGNSSNTVYYDAEAEAGAYENVMCQGEKHWDEDSLWRDNLRRVSHRHARSMDDLDIVPTEIPLSSRSSMDGCGMNSIKRIKKNATSKISRNVTYVNCEIQNLVLRRRENNSSFHSSCPEEDEAEEKIDDNDVYVSLVGNAEMSLEQADEGVYEQLTVELSKKSLNKQNLESNKHDIQDKNRRRFEIDREKLRQWDLMSSGLMKAGVGRVLGAGASVSTGEALCSTDNGTDNASNEASMTMSGTNVELGLSNSSNQQSLSKKAFLGSNTSIGRNNRDANIPVRAVSPRVRWVEEKPSNDHYGSQQITTSQQNLHTLAATEDSWAIARSPSRTQQPIRAVSPRVRRNTENDDLQRDQRSGQVEQLGEVPTAGELLGRTHEELVLLLIQLRRRHAATHRAIDQCCTQINSIEDCLSSLKALEREESLQRLEQLKTQLMELEHQYDKSKPLVQLVDNMVKLGSLYNRPGSTVERLERNQRLRHKVLAEHAFEQQRWLESAAAGKPLETEAARARVAELWALEQELSDEAAILQGLKSDKDTIESLLSGVRGKLDTVRRGDLNTGGVIGFSANGLGQEGGGLEAELARVHAMLAHNSKKLEQTVADNARLERELQQLRRALQARRASAPHPPHPAHPTAMLEDGKRNKLEQTVADNARLERELQQLRRALQARRASAPHPPHPAHPTAMLEDGKRNKLEQTVADNARLERELQQLRRALQARRASAPHPPHPAHPTAMLEDGKRNKLEQTVADNARLERELQQLRRALQARRASAPHPPHPAHPTAMPEDVKRNKLEQTVADNARLERELQQLRRALQARRASAPHPPHPAHPTAMLEDEVSRVQQLVSALQRQRQELSRAVRHLTQQSHALQSTHDSMPGKRRPISLWQETNLDTGHTTDHGHSDYEYEMSAPLVPPGHHRADDVEAPLYVDTRAAGAEATSPMTSEEMQHGGFGNLSNVEKQEIKTVRIVKRESERRQRDRERSLQPMSDWPANNLTANLDQFLEEEMVQSVNNYTRATSMPRTDFSNFEEYYNKPQAPEPPNYLRLNDKNMDLSPKYPSSPSLSNYDYSRDMSSLSSSYNKSYDRSGYDRTISISTQYLNSPTDSSKTLTNDPLSKTSSVVSLTRSHMELSPIFKSEAAKQIITEMSGDTTKTGSLHRRQVPKEKRRHYTAPHHLSAKTLNEMPKDGYNQDKLGRSLDDADMERALRGVPAPDVVRSAVPTRYADSIDQLLAAPQKILIPERYIPEKPPELSLEEQQKRQEKVESIKKMLSGSADPSSKSPEGEEKRQREHLLQMNQILAKQVTEMSKIIAVKALEELPQHNNCDDADDRSPDVELPIYQQRDNFFT